MTVITLGPDGPRELSNEEWQGVDGGLRAKSITITKILATVPNYGTKVINGTSTLKLGGGFGANSTHKAIAEMLRENGWACVSCGPRYSSYSYWAPPMPLPRGGRPVMWLDVPSDDALKQLAAELHQAGLPHKNVSNGVTYQYRPARIDRWEDEHGTHELPHDASFHADKLWWSVLCWWKNDQQQWIWWGPESIWWHPIPDDLAKRLVLN